MGETYEVDEQDDDLNEALSTILAAAKRELRAMNETAGLEDEADDLAACIEMIDGDVTAVDAQAFAEYMDFAYYDGALDTAPSEIKKAESHLQNQTGEVIGDTSE